MKLRPYQKKLVEDWQTVMRKRPEKDRQYRHVYLQAPTGTGKTEVVLAIASQCLPGKRVLFVTPRFTLSEQNEERAEQRLGEHGIQCMTVQKLDSIARAGRRHPEWDAVESADHVFFDEIHLYATGQEVKSVPRILKKIGVKGATYLSATAWGLNEGVLGTRESRIILYRFEDAYRDKVLNPVEIVRYNTGTDLEIAYTLQHENVIELLDMSPEPQARELKRLGVKVGDLNKLIEHRIKCLIDLHMSENRDEPALFFVPMLKYTKFARNYFSRHLVRAGMDSAIVGAISHKDTDDIKRAKVRAFKDGETKIMIAVAMLREGFDYPSLSVVYDCAYNPQNVRLALQKMGRLTRRAPKKPVSRFYYAVDSRLILSSGLKQFLRDEKGSPACADAIMLTAFADSDGNLPEEAKQHRVRRLGPLVFNADGKERQTRLEAVRLWDVRRVAGSSRAERVQIGEIVRGMHDSYGKKSELLAMPEGASRPSFSDTKIGAVLGKYTTPTNEIYDAVFDKKIRAKQPQWFEKTADLKKAKLLAMPKGSPRPKNKTKLSTALLNYVGKSSSTYDPVFDKKIRAKQPQWFEKTVDLNKTKLLAMPRESPRPPKHFWLGSYTLEARSSYDPVFDKKVRAKQPQWFEKTADLNKAKLLAMPKRSLKPVCRKGTLGFALSSYTTLKGGSYDPKFDKRIRAKQPQWFKKTAELKKTKFLAMPKGSPRPHSTKHHFGASLSGYTSVSRRGSRSSYDPVFDKKIRAKQPQWFEKTADKNKAKLLAIPEGIPRPNSQKTKLGAVLVHYTRPGSATYDPVFDKKIRAKQPHWFEKSSDSNKVKLLAMSKGISRPISYKTKIGVALINYTNPNNYSYDPVFDKKIRAKQPQWFEKTADLKKAKLLAMSKRSPRPKKTKTELGAALTHYTSSKSTSYDSVFNKRVRAKQPQWFEKTADLKKAKLLAMPKGSPRPSCKKYTLGCSLLGYTSVSQRGPRSTHDPVFDKKIRAKQPHWFKPRNRRAA